MSIADNFIATMARINSIEPDNDEPMRHQMRACRQRALDIIANALMQADAIAYMATSIQVDGARGIADAAPQPQEQSK